MITPEEKELFAAKLKRFNRTLDKIVMETREKWVLPDSPPPSKDIDRIIDSVRDGENET